MTSGPSGTDALRSDLAHLYRRAGFGADSATLDISVKAGVDATVARLCEPPAPSAEFEKTISTLADRVASGGNTQQLGAWWLYRIRNGADPLTGPHLLRHQD